MGWLEGRWPPAVWVWRIRSASLELRGASESQGYMKMPAWLCRIRAALKEANPDGQRPSWHQYGRRGLSGALHRAGFAFLQHSVRWASVSDPGSASSMGSSRLDPWIERPLRARPS